MPVSTAEDFLDAVLKLSVEHGVGIESVHFFTGTGLRCGWYNPAEHDEDGPTWSREMGNTRQ